jgi:hypothetical protein
MSENHTRDIVWENLSVPLDFFRFIHNSCQRGKALLGALVAASIMMLVPRST